MGKLDKPVLDLLRNSVQPLTLAEIAKKLDKPEKTVFKTLRRLFQKDLIDARGSQYTIKKENL